ncbi:MAG TPA: ABC transporter permease [Phycisphaerae bacterium]|nr:ABC transporter permease [Phycisphaerae bacterium]
MGESAEQVRSPWGLARRRFLKNRLAVIGAVVLGVLILSCFLTIPWTIDRYADQMGLKHVIEPPSGQFWMGTDSLGRDLMSRFLLGGALSLSIGLASALIAIVIGTGVGVVAGYFGGRTDAFLMRVVDVMYGLPYILLVILMRVALVSPMIAFLKWMKWNGAIAEQTANVVVLLVGIGAVSWLTMARVIRGQVLSLRDQPFVEAARAMGLNRSRILWKHIMPNLVGIIVVYGALTVPNAILSESFLSFLGLGIQQPLPSWGNLASEGIDALNPIHVRWWLIAWPCVGLSVALLCLNFVGDGVRDALDPRGQ